MATDDAEGGSKYVPDPKSAEYCTIAFEKMLPAILSKSDPARKSVQSEKAASEISTMLNVYKDVGGTSSQARESASVAAETIWTELIRCMSLIIKNLPANYRHRNTSKFKCCGLLVE